MKTTLFPSIITATIGLANYSVTQKDLDSGVYLLTESAKQLVGIRPDSWSDISEEAKTPAPEALDSDGNLIPEEFTGIASRRPAEYLIVARAFRKAYGDEETKRVLSMQEVIWRNYRIVR